MLSEERVLSQTFPEYRQYAARTDPPGSGRLLTPPGMDPIRPGDERAIERGLLDGETGVPRPTEKCEVMRGNEV